MSILNKDTQGYMETIKAALNASPWGNSILAVLMWFLSHSSECTGVITFLVVLYTLKTSFYKSKLAKAKYDNACNNRRSKT